MAAGLPTEASRISSQESAVTSPAQLASDSLTVSWAGPIASVMDPRGPLTPRLTWMVRLSSVRERFGTGESGATLVEYAVLVAVIAIGYSIASSMLGTAILWGVAPRP